MEVYATWITEECNNEHFVGELEIDEDDMPQELELNGVVYTAQF